jgi:hypothetical protein
MARVAAAKKRKVEPSVDSKPIILNNNKPIVKGAIPSRVSVPGPSAKPIPSTKTSGADMSFFGAPTSSTTSKPRPKLPDIRKRDPSTLPPMPQSTLAPSTSSLLHATLSQLNKSAPASSGFTPMPDPTPMGSSSGTGDGKPKLNKKGHTVKFKDLVSGKGPLEEIREFTQLPKELEIPEWQIDSVSLRIYSW